MESPGNREIRRLKARAQLMAATVFVGREGLSAALLKALDEELARHELVKVKFASFKERKKELAPLLAGKVSARLIMRVGNVVVLYRPRADNSGSVSPAAR